MSRGGGPVHLQGSVSPACLEVEVGGVGGGGSMS